MVLYFIGIGLWDKDDISIKGKKAIEKCEPIYIEYYTSMLHSDIKDLEKTYNKKIIVGDRDLVENKAEETILKDAKTKDTAFLVIGDIFSATTHIDLVLRARKQGIECRYIHNASVMSAVGSIGLELYKYGKTVSIPFNNKDIKSPYENMLKNQEIGLHTLFLLDLDPKNKKYMTIKEGIQFLLRCGLIHELWIIGCAGLGSEKPEIKAFKPSNIPSFSLFPQCFVVPGSLHFIEEEALDLWKV